MRLERLFEVRGGELYSLGGEKVSLEGKAFPVRWSDVEAAPGEYNEDFLARLRDELKSLEAKNSFVFIEPVLDRSGGHEDFTAAMKHCARRIKDCASVIGFEIPEAVFERRDFFIGELSAKHGHYCYFCKKEAGSGIVLC